jgi:hypothetical protein
MNEPDHPETCTCWRCTARLYGAWLDELGHRTASGSWNFFATITFSTPTYPWTRGFPTTRSRPSSDFAHHFFRYFVGHFEAMLEEPLDYAVADQLGNVNGRLHLHALLAGKSLEHSQRRHVESWLAKNAGYSRVLPFERGAAYYLGRYIGRDSVDCEWDVRVGEQVMNRVREPRRWGDVVVASACLPHNAFHCGFPGRKR